MNIIYYAEINLICIVILLLFHGPVVRRFKQLSTENQVFSLLLWFTILLCFSDMVAGVCRGQTFWGARAVIQISNLLFEIALAVISYLWMIYVLIKLKIITDFGQKTFFLSIPLILFTVVALSNPLTGILFRIDSNNFYSRSVGTYFHWAVTWFYLVVPTVQTALQIHREKSKARRKELYPLLAFILPPIVASTVQMLFYGITSSQVGVTISIVIISLFNQGNQILTDALTGLTNRHGFRRYINNYLVHNPQAVLSLFMIDLNHFKQINDSFGHLAGDRALVVTADALKTVCEKAPRKLFLCRFGGDEFLAAAYNYSEQEISLHKKLIADELERQNHSGRNPFFLRASIGVASGKCSSIEDVECLLHAADQAMYAEKHPSDVKHSTISADS